MLVENAPHPFATRAWQRAWWDTFGHGELHVVRLGEAGMAALHFVDGTARFIGGEDVTDYPGPAIAPGREPEAAQRLVEWLDGRPLEGRFLQPAFAHALACHGTIAPDEPVALLPLPSSFEEYLRTLNRHQRHELRRKRRHVTGELREGSLEDFFALFRAAPKGPFMTAANESFFRRILADVPGARLDTLEVDGRAVAIAFGFADPRAYYLYNMAYDASATALSPGIVLLSQLIERAIEERRECFDFLRGLEPYKLALGGRPAPLLRVRIG